MLILFNKNNINNLLDLINGFYKFVGSPKTRNLRPLCNISKYLLHLEIIVNLNFQTMKKKILISVAVNKDKNIQMTLEVE